MTDAKSALDFSLNQGGDEAAEEAASRKALFDRVRYVMLKEGDEIHLRMVDGVKDWLYFEEHYSDTKGTPPGMDAAKWPKQTFGICRNNKLFKAANYFADCWNCDHPSTTKWGRKEKPSLKIYARVVVRKPVLGTQEMVDAGQIKPHRLDKVVGFVDDEIEVHELDDKGEPTGETVRKKNVQILSGTMEKLFQKIRTANTAYGSVLDRDFQLKREAEGEYSVTFMNATESHDLNDPELRAKYTSLLDLQEEVVRKADDEHYATYFDPRLPFPKRFEDLAEKKAKEGGNRSSSKASASDSSFTSVGAPAEQQSKPDNDASEEELAAMRASIMRQNPTS